MDLEERHEQWKHSPVGRNYLMVVIRFQTKEGTKEELGIHDKVGTVRFITFMFDKGTMEDKNVIQDKGQGAE